MYHDLCNLNKSGQFLFGTNFCVVALKIVCFGEQLRNMQQKFGLFAQCVFEKTILLELLLCF